MSDHPGSSLELLYQISRQLVTSLDLQTVLESVVFLSIRNLGAERGNLIVLDVQRHPVEAVMVYHDQRLPYTLEQLGQVVEQGLAGWVLRNRQAVWIDNTSLDERWVRRPDDEANRSGAKSAICIPLQAGSELVGVLTLVHPQPGFFTQSHLDFLQAIGDQAGIAIHNARLVNSLQVATRRYHELFENSIDPILISDGSGRIIEVNRQTGRMIGLEAETLVGSSVLDLHEVNFEELGDQFERVKQSETVSYESFVHRQQGEKLPVEVYVYRVQLQEGEVLQWTLRDISTRKELDMLRTDLAAMVYHDLRSPLSNIISSLDMMENLLPSEEGGSLRAIYGITTRSTERMQRLISSLLDINQLEAGQSITNRASVAVDQLIKEAVDAIQPSVVGKHQQLSISMPGEAVTLWVDVDMIRRVLINLVENATKFTPMNGAIQVTAEAGPEEVLFCVRDSGLGIPAEARELIFDKFRRLNAENSPKGMGLGLAFCRLAVQAHGGRIWVESEVGKGSCFYFTLPANPQV